MSHQPHYKYPPPPENYYIEEPEMYPNDYVIPNEIMEEYYTQNPALVPVRIVTYPRNFSPSSQSPQLSQLPPQMIAKQQQSEFIQQSFINRKTVPYFPQQYEPTREYYVNATISQHDLHYGSKAYDLEQDQKNEQYSRIPRPVVGSKKFPVTFPIPKYHKKGSSSGLNKRAPSLCIPGGNQRDSPVTRKPKKIPIFTDYYYEGPKQSQEAANNSEKPQSPPPINEENQHKVDCQGDVNVKIPNLEEIFEQIEKKIVASDDKNADEMNKLAKLLKPRVPASIRSKTKTSKKHQKQTEQSNPKDVVTEVSSLEKLLNQLKKCESPGVGLRKSAQQKNTKAVNENKHKNSPRVTQEETIIPESLNLDLNSLNYQDINENPKSKCYLDDLNVIETTPKQISSASNPPSLRTKNVPKLILDDNCALELHRSKSYIVNLIDRALSKELGTVPSTRFKELETMNPKRAIDLVNRHSGCTVERNSNNSNTNSHVSNYSAQETAETLEEDKMSTKCKICHCNSEEPSYIKHLKQLRWGHLRHIQREIKRLEELERFLDSCSMSTIAE